MDFPNFFTLVKLATKFRTAVDEAKSRNDFASDICFNSFPSGCCGDTSCLLGQYLLENNIISKYVCGEYHYPKNDFTYSHAWLQVDDTIVDITGDQFKNNADILFYDRRVYVGKIDAMHSLFHVTVNNVRDTAPLNMLGDFASPRLMLLYSLVRQYL